MYEEQLLERLGQLAQLLQNDLARKPKFQKPKRQTPQWQIDINEL